MNAMATTSAIRVGHAGIVAPQRQRGIGLVEVLTALLVLGIGVLGTAALETAGLGYSRTAVERTQAIALMNSMAERIRANQVGAQSGDYGSIDTRSASSGTNCASTVCSASSLAQYDARRWGEAISDALADGYGTVQTVSINPWVYLISVYWGEGGKIAANAVCPVDPSRYCIREDIHVN